MATVEICNNDRHTAPVPLVGICGLPGSGKDSVGDQIAYLNSSIQKQSFAEPLKRMLATMLGVPYEMVEGITDESREWRESIQVGIGKTPRQMMLSLGTEWGRDMVNGDLWVTLARYAWEDGSGSYFTDVRFDNEAYFIKENGGILLEVVNTTNADVATPDHRSEAGIDRRNIDFTVYAAYGDLHGLKQAATDHLRVRGAI